MITARITKTAAMTTATTLRVALCAGALLLAGLCSPPATWSWDAELTKLLADHCHQCHSGDSPAGGLDLPGLGEQFNAPVTFARWVRIYDRVAAGEMPPRDSDTLSAADRRRMLGLLQPPLLAAHRRSKGTVLRRLNRREYEHTMNDLFGTHLDLEALLPEDGRAHEFDNVGAALGLSMVQLQRYLEAAGQVFDAAVARSSKPPQPERIEGTYLGSPEAERFVGKVWKQLADGAVVRFSGGGYPSGMMRSAGVRQPGWYRIRVTGYSYQSPEPVSFSVGATTFKQGAEKPTFGYFSFPAADHREGGPGDAYQPVTVELTAWIEARYMIQIEPYGITDPQRYQRKSIADYGGPGLAIQRVVLEGPLVTEFPSRGHQLVFSGIDRREVPPRNPAQRRRRNYHPTFEIHSDDEAAEARQALQRVASAAFRRPATAVDVEPYLQLFARERQLESFEQALRTAVIAIFCSPRFLYLQEPPGTLDDYALASRLAYFLQRTTPDSRLLKLAETGRLRHPATLRGEAARLMQAPQFSRFLTDFCEAWLNLRELDFTAPDATLFPEYDDFLRYSMPRETEAYLGELIRANLPVRNLVESDFAMLNSRLAAHYDLPAVTGPEIRKVRLPEGSVRGGLLSQAAVLKVSANGTNTSPVTRGVWVMQRILGQDPPPPPPGVPGVEPDIRGAATLRELLHKHRELASCQSCHRQIDPPGFALEVFNPIGGLRARYRSLGAGDRVEKQVRGRRVGYRLGPAVDSSGELPDGRRFEDFHQFRRLLAEDEQRLARAFTQKLLTFATGRELGFSDREEVERIVRHSAEGGYRVGDLLQQVVTSEIFLTK